MKPVVVWNRHARGGRTARALERRLARTATIELVSPGSRDELARVAREFREARIPRLGVIGGDGTVHALLSALDRAESDAPLPALALLGGGTLNTIAASVGMRRLSLDDALDRFAALGRDEELVTTTRATMRCNGAVGSLFGVGVVETFLRAYYAGGSPTPLSAAKLLGTAAIESIVGGATFRSFTGRARLALTLAEGERFAAAPTLAIAAGTIAHLGLGFAPFHRVREQAGVMHLVRFHGEAASLARALPRIRFARPLPPSCADERTTRGFTIDSDAPRLGYMLDGDLYEHDGSSLVVELGPTVRYATLHESPRGGSTDLAAEPAGFSPRST